MKFGLECSGHLWTLAALAGILVDAPFEPQCHCHACYNIPGTEASTVGVAGAMDPSLVNARQLQDLWRRCQDIPCSQGIPCRGKWVQIGDRSKYNLPVVCVCVCVNLDCVASFLLLAHGRVFASSVPFPLLFYLSKILHILWLKVELFACLLSCVSTVPCLRSASNKCSTNAKYELNKTLTYGTYGNWFG